MQVNLHVHTDQLLFDVANVLVVINVELKLGGGGVVGDDGDAVADALCCVDGVSVSGCDVTAVVASYNW